MLQCRSLTIKFCHCIHLALFFLPSFPLLRLILNCPHSCIRRVVLSDEIMETVCHYNVFYEADSAIMVFWYKQGKYPRLTQDND